MTSYHQTVMGFRTEILCMNTCDGGNARDCSGQWHGPDRPSGRCAYIPSPKKLPIFISARQSGPVCLFCFSGQLAGGLKTVLSANDKVRLLTVPRKPALDETRAFPSNKLLTQIQAKRLLMRTASEGVSFLSSESKESN